MAVKLDTNVFDKIANTGGIEMTDLRHGGQWGVIPEIGAVKDGKVVPAWMYNQRYIRRDLIPIVLETPKVFDLLPNPEFWHASCVALFEVLSKTIDGLNASITWEFGETDLGVSGATMKEAINATRESVDVNITFDERKGTPIETFLTVWGTYALMDPDTKFALAAGLDGIEEIAAAHLILLQLQYSLSNLMNY